MLRAHLATSRAPAGPCDGPRRGEPRPVAAARIADGDDPQPVHGAQVLRDMGDVPSGVLVGAEGPRDDPAGCTARLPVKRSRAVWSMVAAMTSPAGRRSRSSRAADRQSGEIPHRPVVQRVQNLAALLGPRPGWRSTVLLPLQAGRAPADPEPQPDLRRQSNWTLRPGHETGRIAAPLATARLLARLANGPIPRSPPIARASRQNYLSAPDAT